MLDKVKTYIVEKNLFQPQDKILVALSGGRDSVTLLHVLWKLGYNIAIAHCNFQLRGAEANEDEVFVTELAREYTLACHKVRFETSEYAQKKGVSIQIAARELRYEWFANLLNTPISSAQYLATAHHSNDNIETILHRLVRGTGIIGLQGIPAKNGQIVRPLLGIAQAEIAQYAQENNLTWREDSSNAQDKYTRNTLRHRVVPVLQAINPNLEQTFLHTLERIQGYALHFQESLQTLWKEIVQETTQAVFIATNPLLAVTAGKVFLAEWLQPYNFAYTQVQNIWAKMQEKATDVLFLSPTHSLLMLRESLIITPKSSNQNECYEVEITKTSIQTKYFTLHLDGQASRGEATLESVYIDMEKLAYPLTLRRWQAGDSFCPLGMQGRRKKVADFLNDQKVPRTLKPDVWVLCSKDAEIVWVVGYRISDKYKLTQETKHIVNIKIAMSL